MKFAILLTLLGFAAMQMVEGNSYSVFYRYPTRITSRSSSTSVKSSSYVSAYLKKMSAYYYAVAQAKVRLSVTSTTENYCNRVQACTSGDSTCEVINSFVKKVCSEGGLVSYIMRRVVMPSLISETDCTVARRVQCISSSAQMICSSLQRLIQSRCPAELPDEETDPNTEIPTVTDAPVETVAPATEAPTQAPTAAPTEAPTAAPTEAPAPAAPARITTPPSLY